MAEHYNTAVIPARPRTPKDKPNAEGTVKNISTWITAALINEKFFSLSELNREISIKLDEYNKTPFQKKEGSRYSVFLSDEISFLTPLPPATFELAQMEASHCTIQLSYIYRQDEILSSL